MCVCEGVYGVYAYTYTYILRVLYSCVFLLATADRCVSFDHNMAPFQFQSVCQLSGEGSCNCQSESPFQPGPCCTAEGKVDTSNKTCLGI